MVRKLGLVLALLALFLTASGQWTVFQTAAWVGMLRAYTQRTGSFAVAVEQTFDGQHPCELCRAIASAKVKEHKEQPTVPGAQDGAKFKALVAHRTAMPRAPLPIFVAYAPALSPFSPSHVDQPPTPPPERGDGAA